VQLIPLEVLSNASAGFATVEVAGSEVRLHREHIPEADGDSLILVVGMSLAPAQAAAQDLMLTLLVCGVIGLVLSFVGAWCLAARALAPIRRAFDRQQEFVADASHELRTPLTILHSAADLLASQPDRADPELVYEIRDEIGRMERLTRDLLTLARSDRGELQLSVGRVELGALARDLARRVSILADARGIQVEVQKANGPASIEGDPDRLHEVGLVLLDNALRHTPSGGIITLRVDRRERVAILAIEDTGEGIPDEHLTRVFDRFHRVDASRQRQSGGAGLGLAIARSIVAAHAGSISIARRPGGGTCVTLSFPVLADASIRDPSDTLTRR
jgi:signal transduction histidine kinase